MVLRTKGIHWTLPSTDTTNHYNVGVSHHTTMSNNAIASTRTTVYSKLLNKHEEIERLNHYEDSYITALDN